MNSILFCQGMGVYLRLFPVKEPNALTALMATRNVFVVGNEMEMKLWLFEGVTNNAIIAR